MKRALLVVDVQYDFLPGGALAVLGGEAILPVVGREILRAELVVATQDWHPAGHLSFAANHVGRRVGERIELGGLPQVLWPVHCVQGTWGARIAEEIGVGRIGHVVQKGCDLGVDSYSGFFDNGRRQATRLDALLRSLGVTDVDVVGLATDYCVKATAIDAADMGYGVRVIREGCRAVNLQAGDEEAAYAAMRERGVEVV